MTAPNERELHELRLKATREQRVADLRLLLSTLEGRRFIARVVFEFGGLEALGWDVDQRTHAFNDGTRTVGIAVDKECYRADRDGWKLMRDEYLEALRRLPAEPGGTRTE